MPFSIYIVFNKPDMTCCIAGILGIDCMDDLFVLEHAYYASSVLHKFSVFLLPAYVGSLYGDL